MPAGSARAQPQNPSITATASPAGTAASRTLPRRTRTAAVMAPRYTVRNSTVGTATRAAVLTIPSPYKPISSRPATPIAASSRTIGVEREPPARAAAPLM